MPSRQPVLGPATLAMALAPTSRVMPFDENDTWQPMDRGRGVGAMQAVASVLQWPCLDGGAQFHWQAALPRLQEEHAPCSSPQSRIPVVPTRRQFLWRSDCDELDDVYTCTILDCPMFVFIIVNETPNRGCKRVPKGSKLEMNEVWSPP